MAAPAALAATIEPLSDKMMSESVTAILKQLMASVTLGRTDLASNPPKKLLEVQSGLNRFVQLNN